MKKWKIAAGVGLLLAIAGGVYASLQWSKKGIVTVQTGRVVRQDLTAIVTASGEVKPRNYINIGSNAQGPARITDILVKEGDRVRRGQALAKLESVQPEADVAAQRATVTSTQAESAAAEASLKAQDSNLRTLEASIERSKADLTRSKLDFDRAEKLLKEGLLSRQDYDSRRVAVQLGEATVRESEARLAQAKAQLEQFRASLSAAQRRITVSEANLRRATDVLNRTQSTSPIDGVVTNLPVRVGETVVPGIQNSSASLIMTIADMSIITAEVKVDETDIVNVKLDQAADVTVDAMPGRSFKGHVIEIGNTAILRSTGLAASQSAISSQEAKDFKVVIALDNPPDEMRPGLSCTAKIITAMRQKPLTIPIQALTVRQKGDLEPRKEGEKEPELPTDPAALRARKEELQGVFVVQGDKAVFKKVETGITGITDIEVVSGLNEGEEIITGSYKVIRTLRNEAKIKVDNKSPVKTES
ncbi:MAG: efflux RND transporter periplasmic adaptor subunit [Acidobacteriota bacterium]|nr:efflux RND transporter periplasmic adaptor subunit [Bryobacteraceae bacterium CoA2 C42]MCA2963047.1 efflux RND transporter periplasmic adaptor subunit [Acidobacteriaceae bacterium]